MNDTTKTGATAVTGAMLAGVILWLCSLARMPAPPVEVAGTIGAALLYGAHVLANAINRRWPAPPEPPATGTPALRTITATVTPTPPPAPGTGTT